MSVSQRQSGDADKNAARLLRVKTATGGHRDAAETAITLKLSGWPWWPTYQAVAARAMAFAPAVATATAACPAPS